MAFRSDREARRTWDPDTGWELRAIGAGPGAQKFRLSNKAGGMFEFFGVYGPLKSASSPDAAATTGSIFFVRGVDFKTPSHATDQQRQLIAEAVKAFGTFYDGPYDNLEVSFNDSF